MIMLIDSLSKSTPFSSFLHRNLKHWTRYYQLPLWALIWEECKWIWRERCSRIWCILCVLLYNTYYAYRYLDLWLPNLGHHHDRLPISNTRFVHNKWQTSFRWGARQEDYICDILLQNSSKMWNIVFSALNNMTFFWKVDLTP